jgi:hypothetical protein
LKSVTKPLASAVVGLRDRRCRGHPHELQRDRRADSYQGVDVEFSDGQTVPGTVLGTDPDEISRCCA